MLDIIQIVADYGAAALIIMGALYLLLKLIVSRMTGSIGKMLRGEPPEAQEGLTLFELQYHPLFSSIEYKIRIEIPSLDLNNKHPIKQQMLKDLLLLYMESIKDGAMKLALREDLEEVSPDRWAAEVNETFNRVVTEFQRNALDQGIPAVVLNKFSRWNSGAVRTIHDYIYHICTGNYGSNRDRTSSFFIILSLLMTTCVVDGDKTFRDLNGELAGKTYKGQDLEY